PAPVWRDAIFGDPLADKMLARIITLQIDAAERQARVAAPRKQNALAVGGKLRIAAGIVHAAHAFAVGLGNVKSGALRPGRRSEITAGGLDEYHSLAVRRER